MRERVLRMRTYANADVESVHATIEPEFYKAENFISKEDFLRNPGHYNVARTNSSRGWKAPIDLLAEKAYHVDPRIFLLPPLYLTPSTTQLPGGYHVPVLTEICFTLL